MIAVAIVAPSGLHQNAAGLLSGPINSSQPFGHTQQKAKTLELS